MSLLFLLVAIIIQAIIFLAYAAPFGLPRPEMWQALALLCFFCSFIPWPWGPSWPAR